MNRRLALLLLTLLAANAAIADSHEAGFLTDYSLLSELDPAVPESGLLSRAYVVDNVDARLREYDGIFVDQPEFFVSPSSKYRGVKPDDAKLIADEVRIALMNRLARGGFNVVVEPNENVIYLRTALTHMMLKKKKRSLLAYTPVGAVAHGIGNATKSFLEKIELVGMSLETEFLDGRTGEVLAAATISRSASRNEPLSWDRMDAIIFTIGDRVRCRMDNSRRPADEAEDCTKIFVTVEEVIEMRGEG